MPRRALTLLLVLAAALAGCGTGDDQDQARAAVERFYDAVRQDDGAAACAELSQSTLEQLESQSGRSCDSVVGRLSYEGGAVVETHVYITNAKVDLRGGESAFLGRENGAWKLTAIACRPEKGKPRSRPYECEVEA